MSFNDIAIVTVRGNGYRINFLYIIKDEPKNLLRKKRNIIKHKNLSLHIKMGKNFIRFGDAEKEKHKLHRYKFNNLLHVISKKILQKNRILLIYLTNSQ